MNKDEFTAIIKRYQEPVIQILYKMVYSWETARDLAQESFLRLWQHRVTLHKDKPVFSLLYKIAANLAIDFLRKQKPVETPIDFVSTSFSGKLDYKEFAEIIIDCSKNLKPKQKIVFILHDFEGLSFNEISEILNMSAGNIRSNLHLARKNIKNHLIKQYQIKEDYFNEL